MISTLQIFNNSTKKNTFFKSTTLDDNACYSSKLLLLKKLVESGKGGTQVNFFEQVQKRKVAKSEIVYLESTKPVFNTYTSKISFHQGEERKNECKGEMHSIQILYS